MKKVMIFSIIFLIIIVSGLFMLRKLNQSSLLKSTKLTGKNTADTLIIFRVNDVSLSALIRSSNTENPILLNVHGGPGIPSMPLARKYDKELVRDFIVVHYDQRGTGNSYYKDFDTSGLSVDIFVNDLIEITKQIKQLYPSQKVILLGSSWGSLISILAVQKNPELYDAYVGVGQIADLSNSDQISYDFVYNKAKNQGNKRILKKIKQLDRNNLKDYNQLVKQRRLLDKTGGKFYRKNIEKELKKTVLISPEYSLCDLYRIKRISAKEGQKLYPEMSSYLFIKRNREIPVPCFFIAGRHDFMVPSIIAENYYFNIYAPYKEFFWFEKSGHASRYEEPEKFNEVLISIRKTLTTLP